MFTGSTDHDHWVSSIDDDAWRSVRDDTTARHRVPDELGAAEDLTTDDHTAEDDAWIAQAACKGRTNLFFGIAGERPERRVRRERAARGMCAECPVVDPCRTLARAGRENGFWGGESEEERAAAGFPPRSISRRAVQQASTIRAEAS